MTDNRALYTPEQRVALARDNKRPNAREYIAALFSDFIELHGDRKFADDQAIISGIGRFEGQPVTVIAHSKGHNLDENVKSNFAMPNPEGYRKAERMMQLSEKFQRPLVTIVDTPGAYPGAEAEERGQGEAIARCLFTMSNLRVPAVCLVVGEGGSGGALALSVADKIAMLENAVYSVLSPEGFASILWKDSSRVSEACQIMKLTAFDLFDFGIADMIIEEPTGGAGEDPAATIANVKAALAQQLTPLLSQDIEQLIADRYQKYRAIGKR